MLFDLDGTLVDSVYQHVLAWREALESEGIELSVWRIHRKIGMSGGLFTNILARETGIELDPAKGFAYVGLPKPLLTLHPNRHGWERFGQDHNGLLANGQPTKPYVEGAWVTKHNGKYYLQYGAPGTEYNVDANGVSVGAPPQAGRANTAVA